MNLVKGAGIFLCTILLTGIVGEVLAQKSMAEQTALQNCLLEALATAGDGVTVGELKAQCQQPARTVRPLQSKKPASKSG